MVLALCSLLAWADDVHPHRGVLPAYSGAPPAVTLSDAERATLAAGQPVKKQLQTATGEGAGGRGIAVHDIHAEPSVVWSKILAFDQYPTMVDNVKQTSVYERSGDHVKVFFVIGAPMISISYYIDHVVHQDEGWMTWRLDYDHKSDFDDTVGFWRVEPLADKPGWTRVTYSVDLKAAGWVPPMLESAFSTMGLTKATTWVKRESEKG
jgi:ribosome-associated toxin RatA of RatAB toxin-antitoxin module